MQPSLTHFCWRAGDLLIHVRVSPKSARDRVGELMGNRLKVFLKAPPVDGKANRSLTKFIAKHFSVSPGSVSLVSGDTSRDKTLRIHAPQVLPVEFQVAPPSS